MTKQFIEIQEHFKETISSDEYPTQSWLGYFEEIKTTNKSEIIVETESFYTVFVWRNKKDHKNLLIGISKKTQKFLKTDNRGKGIKIQIVTKKNEKNEDQLWCKFTIKSDHLLWICLRSNVTCTNNMGNESYTNIPLQKIRIFEKFSTPTPKRPAGNNYYKSFLFRINIKQPENRYSVPLINAKGICSFSGGNVEKIGVIDENRIDIYNQDLEFESSMFTNVKDCPFGVSSSDGRFFVTK